MVLWVLHNNHWVDLILVWFQITKGQIQIQEGVLGLGSRGTQLCFQFCLVVTHSIATESIFPCVKLLIGLCNFINYITRIKH